MNKSKRILCIVLAVLVSFCMSTVCTLTASAGAIVGANGTFNGSNTKETAKILVESKKALQGKTVTVDLSVLNNVGFAALNAAIIYDKNSLTLVEAKSLIKGFNLYYDTSIVLDGMSDFTADDGIIRLTFKVSDNAELKDYEIKVNFFDASNYSDEVVKFTAISGTLSVVESICGDVDGDGVIDAKDLKAFTKAVLSFSFDNYDKKFDFNGDGVADLKDLLRLKLYLADNSVPLGK